MIVFNLFILGVVMLLGGIALLFLGEIKRGREVALNSRAARWIGIFLVSYFPLVLAIRLIVAAYEWDKIVNPTIIHAAIAGFCLLAAGIIWLRGRRLTRRRRLPTVTIGDAPVEAPTADAASPVDSDSMPPPTPVTKPQEPYVPPEPTRQEEKNPFDFS